MTVSASAATSTPASCSVSKRTGEHDSSEAHPQGTHLRSILRGYSAPTTGTGGYTVAGLAPGTDRVAFEPCTRGPYPLSYSKPLTVIGGGVTILNPTMAEV
jgi:hypothetical protein